MSELPLYFPSPNKAMLDSLREHMGKLPIVSEAEAYQDYFAIEFVLEDILKGSIEDILSNLEISLLHDYRENITEIETAPWTFDYLLDRSLIEGSDLDGLVVGTRLISPDSEGSLSYIKTIYRVDNGSFLVPTN